MTPKPFRRPWPLPDSLRALAHRNFRLYFLGHAISILGTWIQQVALAWLVYRLTGSAALLGVTTFVGLVPQLFFGPLAGAWIDKQDKRKWLIRVELMMGLQALLLALLTAMDWISAPWIIVMALILGVLGSFDAPLRQSLISRFVGTPADLPNALALNAMVFNLARFVGPPIAGVLLSATSEAVCFAINGASYLALIVGLTRMRIESSEKATGSVGQVFVEGLRYLWRDVPSRNWVIILSILNITASSYAVLLPVFAKEVFAGDAQTLGWLWGAAGCGAFAATVFLAGRKGSPEVRQAVGIGLMCALVGLGLFPMMSALPWALVAMALLGFGISTTNVGINILLQSSAEEALRGRVVAIFTSVRFGFDALGGLIAGFVAARFGPVNTLLMAWVVLSVFVAYLGYRRLNQPD